MVDVSAGDWRRLLLMTGEGESWLVMVLHLLLTQVVLKDSGLLVLLI